MRFLKLRYLYIIALLFLVVIYLFPTTFHTQEQKEWLDIYFGNFIYLAFFVLFLYGVRMWYETIAEKIVFEIRLYFGLFSFFASLALFFLWNGGLSFQSLEVTQTMRDIILSQMIYEFHTGLIAAYAMYLLLNWNIYPFYYCMYAMLVGAILFFFLVVYKPMKKRYSHWKQVKRERIERERAERAIQEQIKIKKALEREEARKVAQFEQRKIELIQERARGFEMGQLMSSVDLDDDEEEEEQEEFESNSENTEVMEEEKEEQEFQVDIFAEELENKK